MDLASDKQINRISLSPNAVRWFTIKFQILEECFTQKKELFHYKYKKRLPHPTTSTIPYKNLIYNSIELNFSL